MFQCFTKNAKSEVNDISFHDTKQTKLGYLNTILSPRRVTACDQSIIVSKQSLFPNWSSINSYITWYVAGFLNLCVFIIHWINYALSFSLRRGVLPTGLGMFSKKKGWLIWYWTVDLSIPKNRAGSYWLIDKIFSLQESIAYKTCSLSDFA